MARGKLGPVMGLLCMILFPAVSRAGVIELCDVQPNIDYECKNCTGSVRELPIALFSMPVPADASALHGIEFSMSMQVPSNQTAPLRLALDGIDTGIELTGFQTNELVEQSFSLSEADPEWFSPSTEQQLLEAMKDGQVFASLLAEAPEDLKIQTYSSTDVDLCITASSTDPIPEPASVLLWSAIGIGYLSRRKWRKAKASA